jgi:hypothetical protein
VAEQRAKHILEGETAFGKDMFWGFVRAFRRVLQRGRPFSYPRNEGPYWFIINAAGEPVPATEEEGNKRWRTNGQLFHIWDLQCSTVQAELVRELPGSFKIARIQMSLRRSLGEFSGMHVRMTKADAGAAMGLIFAVWTQDPNSRREFEFPLSTTSLTCHGAGEKATKREFATLVRALRPVAKSCRFYHSHSDTLPFAGLQSGGDYPLGHLQVTWDAGPCCRSLVTARWSFYGYGILDNP